jgi:hypothetical protein
MTLDDIKLKCKQMTQEEIKARIAELQPKVYPAGTDDPPPPADSNAEDFLELGYLRQSLLERYEPSGRVLFCEHCKGTIELAQSQYEKLTSQGLDCPVCGYLAKSTQIW